MLKYFCIVFLIMSSFGWTQIPKQKPIEFYDVVKFRKETYKIKEVNYYVVDVENKLLTRTLNFDYHNQTLMSDVFYSNGKKHGQYLEYDYCGLERYGQYENG